MPYITNPVYTELEKSYLAFVLCHDFPKKSDVIVQLNKMKEADITRNVTPYHWIMEFRPNGINIGQGPMLPYITISVLHEHGKAPTEFTLYERNGHVFELEIYNADSSVMNLDTIMLGETFGHPQD